MFLIGTLGMKALLVLAVLAAIFVPLFVVYAVRRVADLVQAIHEDDRG